MKFVFKCKTELDEDQNTKYIMTTRAVLLPEIVELFAQFLKGCGFVFDRLNVEAFKDE